MNEDAKFCGNCGTVVETQPVAEEPVAPATPVTPVVPVTPVEPVATVAPITPVTPVTPVAQPVVTEKPITEKDLPEQFRPLSPWAYFGLTLLYSIPIIGFIFLIIFSFKRSNINRRNFTLSYWCALIIIAAIALVFFVVTMIMGVGLAQSMYYY